MQTPAPDIAPPPPTPTVSLPWCTGLLYYDQYEVTMSVAGGPACPCVTAAPAVVTWDPTLGPFGQWFGTWTGAGCAPWPITIRLRPLFGGGGNVTWEVQLNNTAGVSVNFISAPCGMTPSGFLPSLPGGGTCGGTSFTFFLAPV